MEREYRIACYVGFMEGFARGKAMIAPPNIPYDIPICHTLRAAKWQLRQARKYFEYRPRKDRKVYQFGLHIQYRDVPEWRALE